MTTRRYKVLLEWDTDDEVWVTYVPSLDGISTYGKSREDALKQTQEMILGYIELLARDGIAPPEGNREIELTEVEVVTA